MPGTTLLRGNILVQMLIGPNLTPVSVAGTVTAEQNFTIPGLQVGDAIGLPIFSGAFTALVFAVNARVSAANTLTIAFSNSSGGALTPPSGVWYISVSRPEGTIPTNAT